MELCTSGEHVWNLQHTFVNKLSVMESINKITGLPNIFNSFVIVLFIIIIPYLLIFNYGKTHHL